MFINRKEISPKCSLEGLMLKLKLQYFGHMMQRTDSLEKILMLGKTKAGGEGDDRGWDGWMASPSQWTWVWVNSGSWDGQRGLACCSPWGRKESDTTERLNWTELQDFPGATAWKENVTEESESSVLLSPSLSSLSVCAPPSCSPLFLSSPAPCNLQS